MSAADADRPDIGRVDCSFCGKSFDAPLREQASEVLCPDCFSPVKVPAVADVQHKPLNEAVPGEHVPAPEEPAVETDVYSIASTGEPDKPIRPPKPKRPPRTKMTCEHCGTELTPELRDREYNFTCPDCMEVNVVPAKGEAVPRKRKKRRPKPAQAAFDDPLSMSTEPLPAKDMDRDVHDVMADFRREELPDPPKSTFFSNVFQIPWRADVRGKWIMLSIGFAALGCCIGILHWLYAGGMLIGIPFFVLPAIFLALGTGSYAISGCLTILEETANGNDEITGWNDGGWKDAAGDAFGPVYLAALTAGASYGVAFLVRTTGHEALAWPAFGVAMCLLFPVILLSSLQAGSVWVPLTIPVLKTIGTNLVHWVVYFGLILLVAGAWAVPVFFGLRAGAWFSTLMLSAPLLTACIFIGGRLTGRLAWRILIREEDEEDEAESPTPRRKQPAGHRTSERLFQESPR